MPTPNKTEEARKLACAIVDREDAGLTKPEINTMPEQDLFEWLDEFCYVWDGRAWVPSNYLEE